MHINPERSTRPDYDLLVRQVVSVLEGERDLTANAAQFSALVYDTLADLNWAGFYLTVPSKKGCLLYTSPSPRDRQKSRMPSSA